MLDIPLTPSAGPTPIGADAIGAWFHGATTILVALARDGTVVQANASAVRYAGGDALVGALLWETPLVAQLPATRAAVRDALAAALAGRAALLDVERCTVDGVAASAEFSFTAMSGGEVVLAEGHETTHRRGAPLRGASAGRDLVGPASRELREPLVGVQGALAMLETGRAGVMNAQARELVRLAQANADRLTQFVTDLIDLERVRSGAVVLCPAPTAAAAIGRTAVDALAPLAWQCGVHLVAGDDRGGRMLADYDHTAQALAAILSHTMHAAPPGTSLRVVSARAEGGRVRLTVEDPSSAIAAEHRAAFVHQLECAREARETAPRVPPRPVAWGEPPSPAARPHGDDAGLALSLARALVERQGGTVGASAEADRTAICWVELPGAEVGEVVIE